MANKERNKRAARKARSLERAEREAVAAAEGSAQSGAKAVVKAEKKVRKPSRIGSYLAEVRTEMKRVTWPSMEELKSYSIAVITMLVIFGAIVWAVDTLITGGLAGLTSLRTW